MFRHSFVLASCLLLASGAYAMGGKSPRGETPETYGKVKGEKIIPVLMYVLRDDQGKGNAHWMDDKYTNAIMTNLNEIYHSQHGTLKITKRQAIHSTKWYRARQQKILGEFDSKRKDKHIVVIISGEPKVDYGGIARSGRTTAPVFVMRSRYYDQDPSSPDYVYGHKGISNSTYLFTHELGHAMGLKHGDQVKEGKLHTENYVYPQKVGERGHEFSEKYFKKLLKGSLQGDIDDFLADLI